MTTDAVDARLELHVLNAGYGESIILHLPDGSWGVVDCYASSIKDAGTNAAIQFLKQRGVDRLEFLCLTHPHDDHYRGMSQFFDHFTVGLFWRFAGMTDEGLCKLALHIEESAQRTGESGTDFLTTLQRVGKLRRKKSLRVKHMSDVKPLYPVPYSEAASFRIFSIAPSTNQVETFEDSLKACFTQPGRLRAERPKLDANMVSAALLL